MTTPEFELQDKRHRELASLRIDRHAPAKPTGTGKTWHVPVLAVAGAALIALAGWAIVGRRLPVTVAVAARSNPGQDGPLPVLSGSGYIVTGDRYVSVGVRVPGRIDRYFVEEGQSVHKGD